VAAGRQADDVVTTTVLVDRAFVLLCLADADASRAIREVPWSAGSVAERRQLVRGRLNLAQAAFHLGRYEEAATHLDEGRLLSEELNYDRQRSALETTELLIDWAAGRWKGLDDRCARLVDAAAEVPHAAVDAQVVLGCLAHSRGTPRATEMLGEALRIARACGSLPVLAAAAACLVTIHLAAGRVEVAREVAVEHVELLRSTGIWVWTAPLVPPAIEALIVTDSLAEAEALLHGFASGIRGRDAPSARAELLTARAVMADRSSDVAGAARRWRKAEAAWARLPNPYRAAVAAEAHGQALLRASGGVNGSRVLQGALRAFSELGADRDAARVRRSLRATGVRLPSPQRGGRRGYGAELSPREAEIASLIAQGKRNSEIADLLFLSRRTVELHVANAARKVGARSRTGLAVALLEGGKDT
jgi:DNA-binding CsgD family transcriptional regulator